MLIKPKSRVMEKNTVNADYRTVATSHNVLVNYPGKEDFSMNFIEKHSFTTPSGKKVVVLPHYKKELYFNRRVVIINYFIYPELRGKKIVADEVKIVEKTDHFRNDQKTIIIDVTLNGFGVNRLTPESRLSVGCPSGKFEIPGAPGYCIDFKKIEVKKITEA